MGRKAHKPDALHRRQVEAMAGYGVPEADIARYRNRRQDSPKALPRRTGYRPHQGDDQGRGDLYRKATGEGREAVTAAIFWLKTRAGWKETVVQETKAEVRYVARMPLPVTDMDDWLRRYSSRTIEHEPTAHVGGPFPRLVTERPA